MRKVVAIAVAASALFTLSGCGGDTPPSEDAGSTSGAAPVAGSDGTPADPPGGTSSGDTSDSGSGDEKTGEEAEESTSSDLDEVESCLDNPDITGVSAQEASDDEPTVVVDTILDRAGPNTAPAVDLILAEINSCLTDENRRWLIQVKAATGEIIGNVRLSLEPR